MARKPSASTTFSQLWESSTTLVALFNAERELQYANPATLQWLQMEASEILGQVVTFASPPLNPSPLGGIAPPADAFAGCVCTGSIFSLQGASPPSTQAAIFLPVVQGEQTWVLLVSHPQQESPLSISSTKQQTWHTILQQALAQTPRQWHDKYLIGESFAMRHVRKQIPFVSQTRAPVHFVCEAGCGAEAIAALFQRETPVQSSIPSTAPITIDCALHTATSLGEMLASCTRLSRDIPLSQLAIYLHQVDCLPSDAQTLLLSWLEKNAHAPRLFCSAPRKLSHYVQHQKFSRALAAELSMFSVRLPPLRKRPTDIPLLVQWCVEQWNAEQEQNVSGFLPEAIDRMVAYPWPENIDELQSYVQQACAAATESWVKASDLPERLRTHWQHLSYPPREKITIQLDAFLGDMEKQLLQRALKEARNNKSKAAELLGISRQRLLRRLVQLELLKVEEAIDFQPLDGDISPKDAP
jgi:DNA-binding NtrC family response regulator